MRLFLGARMPRLAQLRFAAPLAKAQARSARPLRRSFRRHFAQSLGGFELNRNAKDAPWGHMPEARAKAEEATGTKGGAGGGA